jgi:hypothetical protein
MFEPKDVDDAFIAIQHWRITVCVVLGAIILMLAKVAYPKEPGLFLAIVTIGPAILIGSVWDAVSTSDDQDS